MMTNQQFRNKLTPYFQAIDENKEVVTVLEIDLTGEIPIISTKIEFKRKKFKLKEKSWKKIGF